MIDQEALALRGNAVKEGAGCRFIRVGPNLEQRLGSAAFKHGRRAGCSTPDANWHRHQCELTHRTREVEQFSAVTAPARLRRCASNMSPRALRYSPFPGAGWKRLDVHLIVLGFIRKVGDPPAVGRDLSEALVELGPKERNRFGIPFRASIQPQVP